MARSDSRQTSPPKDTVRVVIVDAQLFHRARAARDPRFDGWFYVGVTSTGIYCRPSCPARTPKRENVRFFPTAAAAQVAGLRRASAAGPTPRPAHRSGTPAPTWWEGRCG